MSVQSKEQKLIQNCLKGDENAYREIFNQYYRMVHGVANQILKDHTEAEDVAQEVFERVFKNISRFKANNNCTLATWIRRISLNRSMDYLRKKKPQGTLVDPDHANNIENIIESKESLSEVFIAMNELSKKDRALLRMAADEDSSYADLALVFQTEPTKIRGRLYRARKKLRSILKW
ncbi:MAG: sigma-70 family RNA polymerase sigma factor [Candidatus Cloacimonetes bacterium]|nr:sigma-70 family RNA polymerase sigma factor [Candidatus Cloacimonadota bacterium]